MPELSILEIASQYRAGTLTCQEQTQFYLQRIQTYDPALRSVIETNPQALETARRLDEDLAAGRATSPLHGIPLLLKENIDTADSMQTTAGSLALQGHYAGQDAFLVRQLRRAGALLLGKTNLSEWANFRSTRSSSGWSSRGGQCRNPYALDRTPCGSSSGSAVAVAANFCAAAVGTETDGSIICPAQTNGIVGIKPTLGLVSRSGIIPIAHSQDTAGALARTVTDAALLLGALTGADERDPGSAAFHPQDYTSALQKDGLAGIRLGVARRYLSGDPRQSQLFEQALQTLRNLGAELIDPANLPPEAPYRRSELEVLLYEFKADLNAYLEEHPNAPLRSLAQIIAFNAAHPQQVMPYFGQERMEQAVKKGALSARRYLAALEKNQNLSRRGIDELLQKYRLQALVAPSGVPAWMIDLVNGDQPSGASPTSPAAVAGYPHITVPMGYIQGLPVGISFFSTAWQEANLFRFAYAYEQATLHRLPPAFLPTLP